MSKKFFVYGTLKEGGRFANQVVDRLKSVVAAKIMGTMFSINGSYPGVILEGDTEIKGEIHEFVDEEQVEAILDRIEGHDKPGSPHNLYDKAEVMATLEDGSEQEVMLYTFARETDGFEKMDDGIWPI